METTAIEFKMFKEALQLDFAECKKAASILRAINHKVRQGIMQLLDENGKMTVTEIYIRMRLEQSVTSQHLAILRRVGVITALRDGKFIYYVNNHNRLKEVQSAVKQMLNH